MVTTRPLQQAFDSVVQKIEEHPEAASRCIACRHGQDRSPDRGLLMINTAPMSTAKSVVAADPQLKDHACEPGPFGSCLT